MNGNVTEARPTQRKGGSRTSSRPRHRHRPDALQRTAPRAGCKCCGMKGNVQLVEVYDRLDDNRRIRITLCGSCLRVEDRVWRRRFTLVDGDR